MIHKFECWECHHRFRSDDREWVECPHCHSDNVDYARLHIKSRSILAICFTVTIAIGGYLLFFTKKEIVETNNSISAMAEQLNLDSVTVEMLKRSEEMGITENPMLIISRSVYNEQNNTYNCTISAIPFPQVTCKMTISERGGEPIAVLEQAQPEFTFTDLPYSKSDGIYFFSLYVSSTDSLLCELESTDFGKQIHISTPWTAQDLEKHMNAAEFLVDSPYISSSIKINIQNEELNGMYATLSEIVHDVVKRDKYKVSVKSVQHNELNQISVVDISLDYPADWFDYDDEEYYY